jgi:hypothetical protein
MLRLTSNCDPPFFTFLIAGVTATVLSRDVIKSLPSHQSINLILKREVHFEIATT